MLKVRRSVPDQMHMLAAMLATIVAISPTAHIDRTRYFATIGVVLVVCALVQGRRR